MRRLSTLGAGRKDYFLEGCFPRRPGGVAPALPYQVVRAQRLREVGRAQPRPPPAADLRRAPCHLLPIHLKPHCQHCRLA